MVAVMNILQRILAYFNWIYFQYTIHTGLNEVEKWERKLTSILLLAYVVSQIWSVGKNDVNIVSKLSPEKSAGYEVMP